MVSLVFSCVPRSIRLARRLRIRERKLTAIVSQLEEDGLLGLIPKVDIVMILHMDIPDRLAYLERLCSIAVRRVLLNFACGIPLIRGTPGESDSGEVDIAVYQEAILALEKREG